MSSTPLVEQLVELGMQGKPGMRRAQGVQASLRSSETIEVRFENSKLKSSQTAQRTEIDVRVILDGKVGTSSTTDPGDADGVVQRALEAAQFGSPAHYTFPAPQPAAAVKVYDEALLPLTHEALVASGQAVIDCFKAYNPEILAEVRQRKRMVRREFANSSGARFSEDSTGLSVLVGGELVRGQEILFVYDGQSRKDHTVDPLDIAGRAIELFRLAERSATISSGDTPVIFTPAGSAVLLLTLLMGLDGKNVLLGESPLKEKIGERVASEQLTLVDHPLVDFADGSGSYDGEGVPHQVTPLIEKGVLRGFLYDLDTAGRAGTRSTGNGPGCWPTNWLVQPGDTPYADIIRGTKSGLLVEDVMGLGQGNPISGEFSVNVQLGYKIENGEIVGRVKDVMLAGNVYDALKDITSVSSEQRWLSGDMGFISACLPYVQVGRLSVVGK